MAHYVTCVNCKQKFDRDKIDFIQVSSRRYAHKDCNNIKEKQKSEEELDLKKLEDYIKYIFNENFVNPRIKKQIKRFVDEYNYTYSGMLKSLTWWYEVEGNKMDNPNYGIGIIPYIYKEAYDYYYKIHMAKNINKEKNLLDYKPQKKVFTIKSPRAYKKEKKFFEI